MKNASVVTCDLSAVTTEFTADLLLLSVVNVLDMWSGNSFPYVYQRQALNNVIVPMHLWTEAAIDHFAPQATSAYGNGRFGAFLITVLPYSSAPVPPGAASPTTMMSTTTTTATTTMSSTTTTIMSTTTPTTILSLTSTPTTKALDTITGGDVTELSNLQSSTTSLPATTTIEAKTATSNDHATPSIVSSRHSTTSISAIPIDETTTTTTTTTTSDAAATTTTSLSPGIIVVTTSSSSPSTENEWLIPVIIAAGLCCLLLLVGAAGLLAYRRSNNNNNDDNDNDDNDHQQQQQQQQHSSIAPITDIYASFPEQKSVVERAEYGGMPSRDDYGDVNTATVYDIVETKPGEYDVSFSRVFIN
jgi:hypothetical protein